MRFETDLAVGETSSLLPYLKWAGGKRRVVPFLAPPLCLLARRRRLVEPFVGSACVTLALGHLFDALWINDVNADLMNLHERVARAPEALLRLLDDLFVPENNSAVRYYELRRAFNAMRGATANAMRLAALFVYLNRHGYNGLCRYGPSGFNVPFGRYEGPRVPREQIRAAAPLLEGARITTQDFRDVLSACGPGDAVYCDPPYVPLSRTASFTRYASLDFTPRDQMDLARAAEAAAARGALVILSNHDTREVRQLYAKARIQSIRVRRHISQDAKARGDAGEIIAVYPPRS